MLRDGRLSLLTHRPTHAEPRRPLPGGSTGGAAVLTDAGVLNARNRRRTGQGDAKGNGSAGAPGQ